ncbi:MAG: M48 family metallopeptidase [Candidatus Paceibacterota bacterium]
MKRTIKLNGRNIDYNLRKNKNLQRLNLSVNCNGDVGLSIPVYFPVGLAEKFLIEKADWIMEKLSHIENNKANPFSGYSHKDYLDKKDNALALAEDRINHFNSFYNFTINGITIKNQRSRWGSCSAKGNLNFNYKIVYLPEDIADYIVVHELCHLKEMNHSSRFWDLVSLTIPAAKQLRKKLKQNNFN